MTYSLTIDFGSLEELEAFCQERTTKTDTKPAAKLAAKKKAALKPKPEPKVAETVEITMPQLSKATTDLLASKGRTTAVATLDLFGVKKASDLQPEQYADYLDAVKEASEKDDLAA